MTLWRHTVPKLFVTGEKGYHFRNRLVEMCHLRYINWKSKTIFFSRPMKKTFCFFWGGATSKIIFFRKNFDRPLFLAHTHGKTSKFNRISKKAEIKNTLVVGRCLGRKLNFCYCYWLTSTREVWSGWQTPGDPRESALKTLSLFTFVNIKIKVRQFEPKFDAF